jgi:ATP-dependent DNA helicase RecG
VCKLNLKEGLNIEFKRQYVKDLNKTVVAFANTNGGRIYIGIDDYGDVVGLSNPDKELLKLTNSIRDSIKPDITLLTSGTIETINGKDVVILEVQKGASCPYYLINKGIRPEGVYLRHGSSSVPASEAAILKIIKETAGDSYEDLRSLQQDLDFDTLKNEFKEKNIELGESQMKTLHIIDDNGLYTNLGFLLSEQCQHTIKVAVFEGTSKEVFKDRYEFSGSVMKQMKEVFAFLDRYNRTQSIIEGLTRKDTRDYPTVAIRESLLNSIVHRDYSFSGSTLISVFDDRLEFLTIGGLVKGMTREDIMIGISISRNKNLADVFYRLKWIEAYGTGIMKIIKSYKAYPESPRIDITDNAFKITLPNNQLSNPPDKISAEFNDNEHKILNMLHSRKLIKRKDVETELSISQPMAINLLKKLLNKSAIEKVGQGKNTQYTLK